MGLIKNFDQLATNTARKVVLEIVEAGLAAGQGGGFTKEMAVAAMKKRGEEWGLKVTVNKEIMIGEAREIGKKLVGELDKLGTRSVLVACGKVDVTVEGEGRGGANQEVVLTALRRIEGGDGSMKDVVIISIDSDGLDNGRFCGGIGDFESLQKAQGMNFDLDYFLENNDSASFFEGVGDGVETGKLQNDVGDLAVVLKS